MRRALTLSAAVLVAGVGGLVGAGPVAADGALVPGETRVIPVPLPPGDWRGQVPDRVTVQVTALVDLENGCLEPEVAAGDTTCGPGEGELSSQLGATVAPGVSGPAGACDPVGVASSLPLRGGDLVNLALLPGRSWAPVDCLQLRLTFRDLPENNLAQSDSVSFDLRTTALGFRDELNGDGQGDETVPGTDQAPDGGVVPGPAGPPASTGGGSADSGADPSGIGGGPAGLGAAGAGGPGGGFDAPAGGGGAVTGPGAAPAAGGVAVAGQPADSGLDAAAAAPAAPPADAEEAEVIGKSDASVQVGANGAAVQTRAADSSLVGLALMWGSVFVGGLVLGWLLFLIVRRRRRTEQAA